MLCAEFVWAEFVLAEFVMCRVCCGPSLLCAELTRHPFQVTSSHFFKIGYRLLLYFFVSKFNVHMIIITDHYSNSFIYLSIFFQLSYIWRNTYRFMEVSSQYKMYKNVLKHMECIYVRSCAVLKFMELTTCTRAVVGLGFLFFRCKPFISLNHIFKLINCANTLYSLYMNWPIVCIIIKHLRVCL